MWPSSRNKTVRSLPGRHPQHTASSAVPMATVAVGTPPATKPGQTHARRGALTLLGVLAAGLVGGGVGGGAATWYWQGQSADPVALPAPLTTRAVGALPVAQLASPIHEMDIPALFREVVPSVVGIEVSGPRGRGEGTGFIVTDEGHVLTNNHVVEGARDIHVLLADGTQVSAHVTGWDARSDLAVLTTEIPEEKIQVARLGDSDHVQPGEAVIAIGSPFGFDHSVSHGIISAVDRSYGPPGRAMFGLLQTDAPINPGNSGGPLLDAAGEVIGIATMIQSPIPGSVGVGFAIPINRAHALLPKLAAGEEIRRPWIGISYRPVSPELAEQLGLEQAAGFAVLSVVDNSPAERAGLRPATMNQNRLVSGGDIIVAVDGKKLDNEETLARVLQTRTVGETITFTVRRDGQSVEVPVELGVRPDTIG